MSFLGFTSTRLALLSILQKDTLTKNCVDLEIIEPWTCRSRVQHCTAEPRRATLWKNGKFYEFALNFFQQCHFCSPSFFNIGSMVFSTYFTYVIAASTIFPHKPSFKQWAAAKRNKCCRSDCLQSSEEHQPRRRSNQQPRALKSCKL